MEYRLLCVYKCNRKVVEQVDIEVNREMGSTHLAPFIRNISVEDLAYSALNSPRELVYLLNQCGFIKQPFILSPKVLAFSSVQKVITENGWTYGKEGHGSLKKTEPIQIKATASSLPLGVLNGGELYIQDAVHWKDHIKIRLIYDNAIVPFFPVYNELPCRTISNTYFKRNPVAEDQLLHDLEPFIDENKLEMSLPTYDVNFLKLLADKHWKIYIEGQKKQRSEVYAHQSQSGIVWFDKNEHVDDENGIVSQLLNSYLQGRNYKEVGSNIYLYRSNDVIKQDREAITAGILPDGEALKDIYTDNTLLSDNEKEYIESKVKQGVAATLRPYQREGVRWLATMRKNQKGCLLADEMGLGKTLQVLAHLYSLKAPKGPFLIIAPTSLLPNWENEIKKFIPSWADHIDIQDHNPDQAKKIILVSYDILRLNISVYKKLYYDTIVIDEAQIVKNRDTKKYQTIKQLKAYHRIILTGTPIENSLSDIWSHFMILIPSLSRIFKTITKNKVSIDSPQFMELSKKLLKPFILRRTKDEEMKDMPELKVKNVCIELTPRERSIYNHVKALFLKALQTGVSGRMNSIVLEGLQRLRQTCISPSLLPSSINHNALFMSSKMKSALELIKKSIDNGEKVLVFSQFVKALEELDRYLTEMALGHVHLYGDTTNRKACIDAFQHDDRIKVFLISLKAGGVGLNLTAANSVILLDDWWNPAVEDQAFARAHRIGQEHEVTVYRLVCKNTVEQKILQLQEQKRKTVDIFNASGSKLTMEEIKNLID